MIRRISLVFALCFAALTVFCACADGSVSDTVDGAMTALTDSAGNVTGYERRYHNADGQLSRLDMYDSDKTYLNYVLYAYDDYSRLYTETYYRADGIAESRNVYTYGDDGKLSEKAVESPSGEVTVFCYDSSGEVVEKLYYDSNEKLFRHEVLSDGVWQNVEIDSSSSDEE